MIQTAPLSLLLPAPKAAALLPRLSYCGLAETTAALDSELFPASARLITALEDRSEPGLPSLLIEFHEAAELGPEAYKLRASSNSISITTSNDAGKRHALWTLLQWVELNAAAASLDACS